MWGTFHVKMQLPAKVLKDRERKKQLMQKMAPMLDSWKKVVPKLILVFDCSKYDFQ